MPNLSFPLLLCFQEFDKCLNISFALMLTIYGSVAALGYYYWGDLASVLITTDLAQRSPFTSHWLFLRALTVDNVVSWCILVNAYTTYPNLILVMQVSCRC